MEQIEPEYSPLTPCLNQRSRRLWAATEASAFDNLYPTGIQVTDEPFSNIAIQRSRFHGEWNAPDGAAVALTYTSSPQYPVAWRSLAVRRFFGSTKESARTD